jgi:DinB superfamily
MEFDLGEGIAVLERTPAVLRAMLHDLPEAWVIATEGGGTWSPFDIVGHLIDGELTDWIPRARIILEHGATRAFDPYDRFHHLSLAKVQTLAHRLDRFAELRAANLATLRSLHLTASDLAKRGTHPELGAVTLAQLLATWVAHDLDHLVQISRTMAKQYRDAAGPWIAYLRVLRD